MYGSALGGTILVSVPDVLLSVFPCDVRVTVHVADVVAPFCVKHFLLECAELSDIRIKYFTATSMKDLFDNANSQLIVDFIKDINFYNCV